MFVFYRWPLFFFFKQKTAYEMRISDWSSDVCSSDLPGPGPEKRATSPAATGTVGGLAGDEDGGAGEEPDRKSVVEGKSVSVRVDLGGRRIIKKKKKERDRKCKNDHRTAAE